MWFFFLFSCEDPEISADRQYFAPQPIGIWPMSAAVHTVDVLADEIPAEVSSVAIDPMVPPTGFDGSIALSNLPDSKVVIDLTKTKAGIAPNQWDGITVTLWIKPKEPKAAVSVTPQVLMVSDLVKN